MAQFTREEYEKLTEKYRYLTTVGRDEMAEKLKEARSHGDLSENAEYDEARNDQAKMEAEIQDLEKALEGAEIIDESTLSADAVHLGSVVTLFDIEMAEEVTYKIMGKSDIVNDIISDESPVGIACMGKKVGDTADVILPGGKIAPMKIVAIG